MGKLAADGALDRSAAFGTLMEAAKKAGLEEDESRKTINSGLGSGAGEKSDRPLFPDWTKHGPKPNSIDNVRAMLSWMGVTLKRNMFIQRTELFSFQDYTILNDNAWAELWSGERVTHVRWVVNYKEPRTGQRRQLFYEKKADAHAKRDEVLASVATGSYSEARTHITVGAAVMSLRQLPACALRGPSGGRRPRGYVGGPSGIGPSRPWPQTRRCGAIRGGADELGQEWYFVK